MTALDIVKAAIPGADQDLAQHVLWARTPFPIGAVSAHDLYRAASRYRRAIEQGLRLCDWCDRVCGDELLCERCASALHAAAHRS